MVDSAPFRPCALVRWGSRSALRTLPGYTGNLLGLRGRLHLLRTTDGVFLSYELTAARVAEVRLIPELLGGACLGDTLHGNSWKPRLP